MPCVYFNLGFVNKLFFSFEDLDKTLNHIEIIQTKKFIQKLLTLNGQPSVLWGAGVKLKDSQCLEMLDTG